MAGGRERGDALYPPLSGGTSAPAEDDEPKRAGEPGVQATEPGGADLTEPGELPGRAGRRAFGTRPASCTGGGERLNGVGPSPPPTSTEMSSHNLLREGDACEMLAKGLGGSISLNGCEGSRKTCGIADSLRVGRSRLPHCGRLECNEDRSRWTPASSGGHRGVDRSIRGGACPCRWVRRSLPHPGRCCRVASLRLGRRSGAALC